MIKRYLERVFLCFCYFCLSIVWLDLSYTTSWCWLAGYLKVLYIRKEVSEGNELPLFKATGAPTVEDSSAQWQASKTELPPPPVVLISLPRQRIVLPAVTTSDEDTSKRSYFSDDSPTGYSETRGLRKNSQPNENNSESEESDDRRYRDIYHEV